MATIYLAPAPTGDDTRTYVQAQNPATPWATLGKCNTSAVTGDTVSMAAGTYTFTTINWTKNFTFTGAALVGGVPTTILDGGSADVLWTHSAVLTFQNITFQNINRSTGSGNSGVFRYATANNVSYSNCRFENIIVSTANVPLFSIYGTDNCVVTFTSCLFNKCYNSAGNAAPAFLSTESSTASSSITFTNCVLNWEAIASVWTLLWAAGGLGNVYSKNSIWRNNSGQTVSAAIYTTNSYSCHYNFTSPTVGTGNITSDPLFIDAPNSNFNLRPTSPALDSGTIV